MQNRLTYRTAFYLALSFSILFNVVFMLMFLYMRNAIVPDLSVEIRSPLVTEIVKHIGFNFSVTFILSFILFALNFRILSTEIQPKLRILLLIVSTIAATMILTYPFSQAQFCLYGYGHNFKPLMRGNVVRDLFVALFVLLTSQLMYLWRKQQQTALENRTLIAENMRTRYEALKNQVDPHFLFNSLNTLNTLIKIDTDKAQQYVQQLSFVFRYTLQNKEVISLEEELKFTQAYCHLMQIRYGDSLRFEYQIDPRFNNYSIIPLSLQTLVENAIKHNVVSAKQPLTISLVTNDNGTVSVSNPIQLKKVLESGEGVGLANLSERYRLMWQQGIVITQNDGVFCVEIVLLKNN